MNIQLVTGNTITVSYYEWLFILKDEDLPTFYQTCIADDLGDYIDNPFSNKNHGGKIEYEDEINVED